MSETSLRKIRSVEAKSGYRLAISWERGQKTTVDLSDMINKGGVFSELSDATKFAAVRVGENSTIVEWPEPVDDLGYPLISIDGEALHEKAVFQNMRDVATAVRAMVDSAGRVARPSPPFRKT